MALFLFILIWGSLVRGLKAENFELSGTKETRTIMHHKCKGSNLTLNEPKTNATVLHVFVFLGRETLASTSVPATGLFEDRLTVKNDGRVTLTNLTSDDLGRYRVEVQLAKDKLTYNIRVVIKEPPETSDGKLLVMKNVLSDRNLVRLTCGTFTTLGFPPVSAVWKDPAGRTLSSDGFEDQYFYLDLPADTADSGDYCCQLDCQAPDFCCLDDQSPLRLCASVHVQTDKKVAVTTDERVSLGNFTQAMAYLVHRQARCDQLDAYIKKVEMLEVDMLKGIENMRNTTTEARIQLERETNQKLWNFQFQMASDVSKALETCNSRQQQLMTTVSDKMLALEMRLNKGLFELHNATSTVDARMEANMNQCMKHIQKFQLRLDTNISKTVESYNELQNRLMETSKGLELNQTVISDKVENIVTRLNQDGGLELKLTRSSDQAKDLRQRIDELSDAADKHRSQFNKQITELGVEGKTGLSGLQQTMNSVTSQLEKTFRQTTSDLRVTMSSNVQTLTNLTSKTEIRVSELEKKLSAIADTLNRLVTNTSQSLEALRLNTSAIYKKTSEGQCLLKTGFVWYKRTCLKVSTTTGNYTIAKAKCEADEAHLYDVKSPVLDEERVRFAIKQTGKNVSTDFWSGGNDLEVEGSYRWSDGTPLSSSYKLWASSQPNDAKEAEDCVIIYVARVNFRLYDRRCSNSYHYICQYDL